MAIGNALNHPILDEDTMASDSNVSLASQQSIKAYVDSNNSGGMKWEMVEEIVIASAVTTQDFTATLDGDVDGAYVIEGRVVNDQGSNAGLSMRINGATWAVNRQYLQATSTTISAARDTGIQFAFANATTATNFKVEINAIKTGDVRNAWTREARGSTTTIMVTNIVFDITTPANSVNITSLGLISDLASGIGIGSVLRLWKRVKNSANGPNTSGTYTPTRSAEANMDANVIMTEAQYMRIGNTVTVSGRFTADPTSTSTATSFEITLPVASNIGAVEDCAGVAFAGGIVSMGAAISGSVANNTAVFNWVSSDVTSQSWSYTFSYQII